MIFLERIRPQLGFGQIYKKSYKCLKFGSESFQNG
jgi:hypothetical protein